MKQKDEGIVWGPEQTKALDKLLTEICKCGLLLPIFEQPFILTTDFSYDGIGGMLSQVVEGVERPIMFCSRVLQSAEKNYSPTEGEALAILFCLRRFEHILYG
jgi:hypothetical protein